MNDTKKQKPANPRISNRNSVLGSIQKLPSRQERWNNLNSSLNQALSQWNTIAAKTEGQKSREEQHLDEVKGLLSSLKSKLDEF
ncbi:MAG: hypothetical protein ACK5W9_06935 [Bdellovibrionales bacterium]